VVIVGLMTWELHLVGCHSLKDKRHVLKSLKDRLHNRFNVSAAETDHHDLWQRAELSVCVVSTDRGHAERVLREADRLVAGKPAGPTSHDVVDAVRRALATTRVGHLGTLDPFAAGLLVVVVGRATRLAVFAAAWTKAYEGVIRLGATTATDDATGPVLTVSET